MIIVTEDGVLAYVFHFTTAIFSQPRERPSLASSECYKRIVIYQFQPQPRNVRKVRSHLFTSLPPHRRLTSL